MEQVSWVQTIRDIFSVQNFKTIIKLTKRQFAFYHHHVPLFLNNISDKISQGRLLPLPSQLASANNHFHKQVGEVQMLSVGFNCNFTIERTRNTSLHKESSRGIKAI